jgi:hypothetical protein
LRKGLLLCAKIVVSAGLVAFVLQRAGLGKVLSELSSARPGFLVLAVVVFLLSNLLGAFQWGLLLRVQGIRIPFGKVFSLYQVGVFFNNFLISNIGGDVIRVYDVRKIAGDGSSAFAATFLDRFIGLFSLICVSIATYIVAPGFAASRSIGGLIVLLGMLLVGAGVLMLSNRLGGAFEAFLLKLFPRSVGARISRTRRSFYLYRSHHGTLVLACLVSVVVQLLRVALHYAAGLSLGVSVGFEYFLIFIPLIAIVASIPISFGGIGVRENFGVFLFQRVGLAPTTAFSMEFLAYLMGLVGSVAGGVIFVLRGTARRRDAEPRGSGGRPTV